MSLLDAELAGGRQWTRVGDCYDITKKPRSTDRFSYAAIPFLPMEAIPQGGAYAAIVSMRTPDQIASGAYFERGDILIAKITPSFENGKQALALDLPAPFGYASTEIIPLHPKDAGHDRRLLFFYLLHPDIRAYVAERMEGSTGRQRVPENVLLDLAIPDFLQEEQTAIASALEAIQQALSVERKCEQATRDLKRATMSALFTRGLRGEAQKESEIGGIPARWDVVPLGSLGRVGNGSTPKRTVHDYWRDGAYPWLTSAKMYDREISEADEFVTEAALRECHLPKLEPGTILMAITGQGKTLGHCAVLRTRATINQHVAYITVDQNRVDPSFVRGYLETQYDYLRQVGSGGGSTKGALTCAFLRGMPIPLPPTIEEQQEISTVLDSIDRKIDLHHQKRAVVEDLFKSLLHKLMTGEIRVADLDLSALASPSTSESAS